MFNNVIEHHDIETVIGKRQPGSGDWMKWNARCRKLCYIAISGRDLCTLRSEILGEKTSPSPEIQQALADKCIATTEQSLDLSSLGNPLVAVAIGKASRLGGCAQPS